MYLNKEICAKCKGECCKQSGCLLSTRDIRGTDPLHDFIRLQHNQYMIKAIQLKKYDNVYLIKTRSKNQDVFETIDDPNSIRQMRISGQKWLQIE